ncbi:MAG: hypothetical protein JO249_08690 [Acidobacteria bacterium]|nr:hypothetical protein [Acidobacteriota bacterium]
MLTIDDQIWQLRVELNNCGFSRRERRQAEAELKRLMAEQAELDRVFDQALEALDRER